ncbi:MAG: hypothetical protein ACTSW1_17160 [Candidatus Hodarchaeales archaeon]
MEESEFRALIQNYAVQAKLEQGEASLNTVVKLVITENPELRSQIRTSMAIVKEEISKANAMNEDELSEFTDTGLGGEESSEYEMLEKLVLQKITGDKQLIDHVKALIIYGSYAKRLHVVGESDINFVVVLKPALEHEKETIEKINEIADEIITPEVAHIFDLMILKEDDLNDLSKFGSVFTYIHALYAKDGYVKYGKNVFKDLEISESQIKESARIMIADGITTYDEIINTAKEEGLPESELEYLVGASIIDIAFALSCYEVGLKCVEMDLVKPDIYEEIREIFGEKSLFSKYYNMFEQAHAFKLGIKLPDSQNFMETSIEFIKDVIEYTKLNESTT